MRVVGGGLIIPRTSRVKSNKYFPSLNRLFLVCENRDDIICLLVLWEDKILKSYWHIGINLLLSTPLPLPSSLPSVPLPPPLLCDTFSFSSAFCQ